MKSYMISQAIRVLENQIFDNKVEIYKLSLHESRCIDDKLFGGVYRSKINEFINFNNELEEAINILNENSPCR